MLRLLTGKRGGRREYFRQRKMLAMEDRKMAATVITKFGCFICHVKHIQMLCPQLKLGKSIRCGKCGDHRHLTCECPRPRRKRWKRKGRLSIGCCGGKQGSSQRRASSSTAKVSQEEELQEVEAAVRRTSSLTGGDTGSRGVHSSSTITRVARRKRGQLSI